MRIYSRKVIYLINYLDKTFVYFWFIILFWFIVYFPYNNPLGRYYQSSNGAGGHAITYILFLSIGTYISLKQKSFSIGVFAMLILIFLHELIFNIGFLGVYWHYLLTPSYIYFLNGSLMLMILLGIPLIFREFRILLKQCIMYLIEYPFLITYFLIWIYFGLPISLNVFIPHMVNNSPKVNLIEITYSFIFAFNVLPSILKWRF